MFIWLEIRVKNKALIFSFKKLELEVLPPRSRYMEMNTEGFLIFLDRNGKFLRNDSLQFGVILKNFTYQAFFFSKGFMFTMHEVSVKGLGSELLNKILHPFFPMKARYI